MTAQTSCLSPSPPAQVSPYNPRSETLDQETLDPRTLHTSTWPQASMAKVPGYPQRPVSNPTSAINPSMDPSTCVFRYICPQSKTVCKMLSCPPPLTSEPPPIHTSAHPSVTIAPCTCLQPKTACRTLSCLPPPASAPPRPLPATTLLEWGAEITTRVALASLYPSGPLVWGTS